jgi:hypothetical protein
MFKLGVIWFKGYIYIYIVLTSHSCSGLEIRLATPLNEWHVSPFGPCDPGLGCW